MFQRSVAIVLGLAPFVTLAQLNEPYIVRNTVSTCLHVRPNPNPEDDPVACLDPGTPVTVVNSVPFWREIMFANNQRGWVAKRFIEPTPGNSPTNPSGSVSIPGDAFLTVHFIDVAQGDAIWIQTHDDGIDGNGIFEGYSIIIDGGPYYSLNENPVLTYIEDQVHYRPNIEALIVSHPHSDHFYGAEAISRRYNVNHYYDPGYTSSLVSYRAFLDSMNRRAQTLHVGLSNFGQINWGAELQVQVLYSWTGDAQNRLGSGNTEVNNSSIVLRIQYGDHTFLFMGDAEGKGRDDDPATPKYVEKILLDSLSNRLKADVLKIAHHGSETSSTIPFINAVDPSILVVSSGRKSFGGTFLPDLSTLSRYCLHNPNISIYRTDQDDELSGYTGKAAVDGDHVVLRTNGAGQIQVQAFEGGQVFTGGGCPVE